MPTIDINKELYIPILSALNVDVDESGQLMMKYPDRIAAATVNKRNLLLPTQEVLRAVPENALVFHPLSENVARGDSAIQNYLKTLTTFKVTFAITYIAQQLYTIASDSKLHGKLKGDQLTILSILPEADAKGLNNLNRVLESIEMNKVRLYNVFNKRNGSIGGSTYNRVAVATFPLLAEMNDPADTLWGHRDVRKRDAKDFRALFDYIVPEWDEKDHYSAASDSMEAPSFQALMLAFVKIMEPLNRIAKIYGEHFKDRTEDGEIVDMYPYVSANTEFQHRLSNLSKYRNVIPVMSGNDGEALAGSNTAQEVVQNPRSVAPAFTKQNLGDDIKVPEPNVQNNAPQNTYQPPVQQQTAPPPIQQQQQHASGASAGVAGFGNYSTANAQQRQMPNYPTYGQGSFGYQNNQQQQTMSQQSGVAGFGTYGSGGGFVNQGQQQQTFGWPNQQQVVQQQQSPSIFDSWNATALQQNQVMSNQTQPNPYTMPSPPAQQQGFGFNPYGGQQQQMGQWVVLPNGQQAFVNQFGQPIQPPMQQGGFGYQNNQQQNQFGTSNGFGNPNPYGVQQIGFKPR